MGSFGGTAIVLFFILIISEHWIHKPLFLRLLRISTAFVPTLFPVVSTLLLPQSVRFVLLFPVLAMLCPIAVCNGFSIYYSFPASVLTRSMLKGEKSYFKCFYYKPFFVNSCFCTKTRLVCFSVKNGRRRGSVYPWFCLPFRPSFYLQYI